ncbi:MAG: serine hydrolase domain-containing protein [Bacteroidota bacterium]
MRILLFTLALLSCLLSEAQPTAPPTLDDLKEKIADKTYRRIDAIIVEQCDELIIEEYFNDFKKDSRHDTRSSFKSITSLLTGIAIDKGLLALDDPLQKFFPELKGTEKGKIKVQHLLEMRSGINCEEFYGIGPECEDAMWNTEDWIAYCLSIKMKHQPGLNWSYSSNDPMIMGEVVARASGRSIMDFAKQHLFEPMGISDYEWTISPKGRGMTAGSFYIRPIDLLKITRLVYNKGNWEGKQLVSEAWIKKSTDCEIVLDFSFTRYSRMPNAKYTTARYGFYWYREPL